MVLRQARFRSALRVDPLLAVDWSSLEAALRRADYPPSIAGARAFLNDWIDTMKSFSSAFHLFLLLDFFFFYLEDF